MADYPNSLEIAQKLLDQQGEINELRAKVAKVRDIHTEFKIYVDAAGLNLRWPPKTAERSSGAAADDPWANGGTPDAPPF
jgi:hypothetical protein